jgi:hypothetical protein
MKTNDFLLCTFEGDTNIPPIEYAAEITSVNTVDNTFGCFLAQTGQSFTFHDSSDATESWTGTDDSGASYTLASHDVFTAGNIDPSPQEVAVVTFADGQRFLCYVNKVDPSIDVTLYYPETPEFSFENNTITKSNWDAYAEGGQITAIEGYVINNEAAETGTGGGSAATVVSPFPPPVVLAREMGNMTFISCIDVASQPADVYDLCGAVVDLTGDLALPPYAGHNDTDMLYVGSLAKIYPMYAAFVLRRRVTTQAKSMIADGLLTATAGWQDKVFAELKKAWQPQLDAAFLGLPSGFPNLAQIFTLSPDGEAQFTENDPPLSDAEIAAAGAENNPPGKFRDWMRSMLGWSNLKGASKCIRALSYPYINGVLGSAGFFDKPTKTGLWISGDFDGHDWLPNDQAGQRLTPRWQQLPKHPVSNFTGTALQVARFMALLGQGTLVDSASSAEMINILGTPFIDGGLTNATPPRPFTSANGKVGIGTWDSRFHDCAVVGVERDADPTRTIRYAVVVLGSPNNAAKLKKLEVAYHDCIVARHP